MAHRLTPETFQQAFLACVSPHAQQLLELWNDYDAYTRYLLGVRGALGVLPEPLAIALGLGFYHELECPGSWKYNIDGALYCKAHPDDSPISDHSVTSHIYVTHNVVMALEHESNVSDSYYEMRQLVGYHQPYGVLITYPSLRGWLHRPEQCLERYTRIIQETKPLSVLPVQSATCMYIVVFGLKRAEGLIWNFNIYNYRQRTFKEL